MNACWFPLYALIALVYLVYFYIKNQYNYWQKRDIPYLEPQFLLGSFYARRKTGKFNLFKEIYNKYRGTIPFAGYFTFTCPSVVLLDLDLIRNVLIKDFDVFEDRGGTYYNEKSDPISAHMFVLEPSKWRRLRGKLSPTFTSGKMKMIFPMIMDIVRELFKVVDNHAKDKVDVDTKNIFSRFTIDVIGKCGFGIDCNSLKYPNAEFYRVGKETFDLDETGFRFLFIDALPKVAGFLQMLRFPVHISRFYTRVVNETVEYRETNNIRRNDFMDLLIDLKNKNATLSMDEIVAQSFLFLAASFSTSSTTMDFVLYELAKNQPIQERLRQEIKDVVEQYDGELTYYGIKEMTYLSQVISETLRMYSPVSHLFRTAKYAYPTGHPKFIIPKGASVAIPIHNIHYDPEIYPNPEIFDPERFSPNEISKRHPMSWLAFGDGPRNCIGLRFGKMQMYLAVAMLIRNFKFSTTKDTPIPMTFNPVVRQLTPERKILLKVERIEDCDQDN